MAGLYRLALFLFVLFFSGLSGAAVPMGCRAPTGAALQTYNAVGNPASGCHGQYNGTVIVLDGIKRVSASTCGVYYHCSNGTYGGSYQPYSSGNVCPANSTQSGSDCVCNSGYVEDGDQCVPKQEDPCELLADMCAGSAGMSSNFSIDGKKAGISFTCMAPVSVGIANPLPGCNKGCMAAVGGFTTAIQSSEGKWVTQGTAKYAGSTCDPSVINDLNGEADPEYVPEENPKTTPESDPTCTNGFKGQLNGVTVCVPPKASSGVTQIEEKANGDGTKTNSKTEVKCENGKCQVTTSSTTTNTTTNNTVSSSSTTTTVDKADYCSKNKTAGACKDEKGEEEGKGKFGGSCSAGFTCEGDALQCAIAKEQHKRNCETSDDLLKTDEYKAWQSAKAWDGKSVTGNLPGNRDHTISLNLGDEFIGSGSCPPDKVFELPFGTSLTIPFSELCPWLILLGKGFVIVAYIAGALIIIRRQS